MNGRNLSGFVFGMTLAVAAASYGRQTVGSKCAPGQKTAARGRSSVVEAANFRIYGISRLPNARTVSAEFERVRGALCRTWLERELPDWSPKCDVVVHSTAGSYARAVGQDQFATVGSSRIDTADGQITLRRLDIRADQPGWFAAAVPHELTHVIMAEEFAGGLLPIWADEGMAVLADTPAKQSLHRRDFIAGRRGGGAIRLVSFVGANDYPSPEQIPVFYGQAVSLVKYLAERRSPAALVRFLHLAEQTGFDAALAEVYGYNGVAELERQWLSATSATRGRLVATSRPEAAVKRDPS